MSLVSLVVTIEADWWRPGIEWLTGSDRHTSPQELVIRRKDIYTRGSARWLFFFVPASTSRTSVVQQWMRGTLLCVAKRPKAAVL